MVNLQMCLTLSPYWPLPVFYLLCQDPPIQQHAGRQALAIHFLQVHPSNLETGFFSQALNALPTLKLSLFSRNLKSFRVLKPCQFSSMHSGRLKKDPLCKFNLHAMLPALKPLETQSFTCYAKFRQFSSMHTHRLENDLSKKGQGGCLEKILFASSPFVLCQP